MQWLTWPPRRSQTAGQALSSPAHLVLVLSLLQLRLADVEAIQGDQLALDLSVAGVAPHPLDLVVGGGAIVHLQARWKG